MMMVSFYNFVLWKIKIAQVLKKYRQRLFK